MPLANVRVSAHARNGDAPEKIREFATAWNAAQPTQIELTGVLETDQANMKAAIDEKTSNSPFPVGYTATFAGHHIFHGPNFRDWEWVNTVVDAMVEVSGPEPGYLALAVE